MSDYICESILIRIFKHLDVRSILRFRSVCKCWKVLFDSEEFMHEHLAVQKPQFLVDYHDAPQISAVELRIPPFVRTLTNPIDAKSLSLLGTLHGVVCLYDDAGRNILIWNPSIRKFSTIPAPSRFEWYTCHGFWIDPSTKEYKIIVLALHPDSVTCNMKVNGILYSSIKHDWTAIPRPEFDQDCISFAASSDAPVMIAGVAHWKGSYISGDNNGWFIVCFDFTQESSEFIEMPHDGEIIQWQGTLSVLSWDYSRCEIHTRQEGLWVHVFSVNLSTSLTADTSMLMLGEINEGFWALFKTEPKFVILRGFLFMHYNLRWYDATVGCIPLVNDNIYRTLAYDFVESLLFP